jgi:LysR family transcriptional activator of nhaA
VNYQHLFYFHTVAVRGGITAAARWLRLTPPTLSAQIRTLEEMLEVALFERSARGMVLTEQGHLAVRYAERIFALGDELEHALRAHRGRGLRIGVERSISAVAIKPFLTRLTGSSRPDRVVCSFASRAELLQGMRVFELDVVFTLAPLSDAGSLDLASRLLLETEVGFFASRETATTLRSSFPESLRGAAFIAPPISPIRESLERWLARADVRMSTSIEIGDPALAAALAADGVGIVAAPMSAEAELDKHYDLALIGVARGVRAQVHLTGSPAVLDEVLPPEASLVCRGAIGAVASDGDGDPLPEHATSAR